jgi:NAD-dependent SIR2 family protein deacetylase
MKNFMDRVNDAKKAIENSEYILIGAGAGLSAAAGFSEEKIFEVQGDYSYLQCAKACHDKLYYNEEKTISFDEDILRVVQYLRNIKCLHESYSESDANR